MLNSVPETDLLVLEVIEELEFGIKAENEGGKATWAECFSTRNALWKRTINGMMLQFIQQLNGQNFYYYYGDTFFASAGTEYVLLVKDSASGNVLIFLQAQPIRHSNYPRRRISCWNYPRIIFH